MANYDDFSFLETMSIEIGSKCNLLPIHKCCPANFRCGIEKQLTIDQIVEIMDQAVQLKFNGLFAFHFYNEPLLYSDEIATIKRKRPDYKFLLWTNGTLIEKLLSEKYDFGIFDRIVVTRYKNACDSPFFYLKAIHNNVEIYDEDMDDRLHFYEAVQENFISCKKIYFELPIDC